MQCSHLLCPFIKYDLSRNLNIWFNLITFYCTQFFAQILSRDDTRPSLSQSDLSLSIKFFFFFKHSPSPFTSRFHERSEGNRRRDFILQHSSSRHLNAIIPVSFVLRGSFAGYTSFAWFVLSPSPRGMQFFRVFYTFLSFTRLFEKTGEKVMSLGPRKNVIEISSRTSVSLGLHSPEARRIRVNSLPRN